MATLQEELEARRKLDTMLADFERQTSTETTNPGEIFRGVINSTPGLREQYERAIKDGHLVGIEAETDPRFNGSYDGDSRKMRLSVGQLNEADPSNDPHDVRDAVNFIRYTAGHEIDHALHREENARLTEHFRTQVAAIAAGPSPHDFTGPVKEFNEGARVSEARAEIAGFNTVAAQLKHDNPKATVAELYEVDGGVSNYMDSDDKTPPHVTVDPGLHIKPDLQLDAAKSLEAMAKTFYDDHKGIPRATSIGHSGRYTVKRPLRRPQIQVALSRRSGSTWPLSALRSRCRQTSRTPAQRSQINPRRRLSGQLHPAPTTLVTKITSCWKRSEIACEVLSKAWASRGTTRANA
ncbi:hypothetical protein [Lysobacter sp. CA199]|uniref:hypothetical protein n=1 Tax=Lysobacter sp. CA199 TaxID=3455608 RepID=UPI003F8D8463